MIFVQMALNCHRTMENIIKVFNGMFLKYIFNNANTHWNDLFSRSIFSSLNSFVPFSDTKLPRVNTICENMMMNVIYPDVFLHFSLYGLLAVNGMFPVYVC